MTKFFPKFFLASLFFVASVNGFLYNPTVHPNLKQFADSQLGKLMKIRFDLGKQTSEQRLSLQGPVFKLLDSVVKTIPLPGAHGPHPQMSSGAKELEVVKEGFVIDLSGMKTIPFEKGCWEMNWKEGSRAGNMVCAFDIPEAVTKNGASFASGSVYITFPVWTKEGLLLDQAFKSQTQELRQQYMQEKHEAIGKMQETNNPIQKAMYYHQAASAVEKAYNQPSVSKIPDVGQTIELSNGLVLSKQGTVWTKKSTGLFSPSPEELGVATIALCEKEED